MKMAEAFEQ